MAFQQIQASSVFVNPFEVTERSVEIQEAIRRREQSEQEGLKYDDGTDSGLYEFQDQADPEWDIDDPAILQRELGLG